MEGGALVAVGEGDVLELDLAACSFSVVGAGPLFDHLVGCS
jgi:hypothetical protein